MTILDEDILRQLRLGEDSSWEFKQIEFAGNRPTDPDRSNLADEFTAFANANGGILLCGASDDGQIQGMTREQMDELDELLVHVATDTIEPALRIGVHRRDLDGRAFLLVEIPKGDSLHERRGVSYIRVGASKRRMSGDERLRLAQRRAQARYLWFDEQPLPETGFNTLDPSLWRPLLSAAGAVEPEVALEKLKLLAPDGAGVMRATVAGVLLCTSNPEQWLPNATIAATRYHGADRTTGQVDAQEIRGPLMRQISDAVTFAVRNMRVAARKTPARIDMPQYGDKAIFEAVVNAVVHRDYSVRGSRIRLSMFSNRLEIQSPGTLPNNLTLESMAMLQATRNQAIASLMGRMPVGEVRGSGERRYFMERRGDGVPTIQRETRELSGKSPEFRLIENSDVLVILPAAPQEATSVSAVVTIRKEEQPLPEAEVLVLFPNKTWKKAVTDENGEAGFDLYTAELPMTVFAAAPGCAAALQREWLPSSEVLSLELSAQPRGGRAIFPEDTGHLPGLRGRLNPIRDSLDRTYLYASNIAIEQGKPQPVHFLPGEELRLTDSDGADYLVRIVEIIGRSALLEYRVRGE